MSGKTIGGRIRIYAIGLVVIGGGVAAALSGRTRVEAEAPQPTPKAKPGIDPELVKLLGDAIKAAKRDARGFASLSEIGQLAGNRSSFDARNYGYSRLSELVEAIPRRHRRPL